MTSTLIEAVPGMLVEMNRCDMSQMIAPHQHATLYMFDGQLIMLVNTATLAAVCPAVAEAQHTAAWPSRTRPAGWVSLSYGHLILSLLSVGRQRRQAATHDRQSSDRRLRSRPSALRKRERAPWRVIKPRRS